MGSVHPAKASPGVAFSAFLSPPLVPLIGAAKTPVPTCSVCWSPTPGGERLHTLDRKWGAKEPLHPHLTRSFYALGMLESWGALLLPSLNRG